MLDALSQNRLEVLEILKNHAEDRKAVELADSAAHAYDMYCFSRMVIEIISKLGFEMNDFQTVLERSGLHASPQQRPTAAHLLKHSAFKNPFAYIVSFLSDYVLKSDTERFHFFDELPKLARQISEEVFCSSIIPLILVPSVFTDFPAKPLVRHLLTPRKDDEIGLVSEAAFSRLVVPYISRLFRCHELTTRLLLLQHFKAYARLMGYETLRAIILPEVCMGVYDVNEDLAVASLSGLAHLAHLLGITCTMGHFQSLGSQLENQGFLTTTLDPETSSAYHKLMVAPTKKPIAYCITKRPWRRTCVTFYPDSSPKANRQAREASTETRNDTERRLCDMAVLSAKYVPTAVPVRKSGDVCPPIARKLPSKKPIQNRGPFSNSYPSVSAEGMSPVKSAVLNIKDSSEQVILNGLGSPVPNVPEGKLPSVKEDSTVPPSKDLSSQSLTADNNDSDNDRWNDWTSDSEDDKLAAKASSSLSLKSSNFLSRTETELGESVTQVKAILEELELKTTSYSAVCSISQRGDLSSAAPFPSADGSLRYKVENAFGDSNDEGDEDEGGWSAEDDEF
ncbi:protein associating with the carboxyl terminal [Echinococcus multilocularis]|uniref:Protein associating with the carboxyl terminal n=1 Tax=Echinococcus multilocularis TaxID=6211 RepID=A0A068Y5V3_ECHMU|nr:protein associating with the carboxyl terminal [Echinococcus multilocularis]